MEWKKSVKKDNGNFQIPARWVHIHYYEALNLLFRIENSLRVFTYIVLKNRYFDKWHEIQTTSDDSDPLSIEAIAKRRIQQSQKFGYLGYLISCPIMHLTSGELIRIIFSEAYWPLFKKYFKGSKEVMQQKLDEIGNIRNALAHFRPLNPDDVEIIKINAKHTLMEIDDCLLAIARTFNLVPSNTLDQWYMSLVDIKSPLSSIRLQQDTEAQWIKVLLTISAPVLREYPSDTYKSYRVLRLDSPAILKEFSAIRKYITYMSESLRVPGMPDEGLPEFSKSLSLIFRKDVLEKCHADISADIKNIYKIVEEEANLLQKDGLAKGRLISVRAVYATQYDTDEGEKEWSFNLENMKCLVGENDPPEYWGNLSIGVDMISGAQKYPWMPVDISQWEAPF